MIKKFLWAGLGCFAASAWFSGWCWGSTWVYAQTIFSSLPVRDRFLLSYSLGVLTAVIASIALYLWYDADRKRRATATSEELR
jgi:membrane protein DedA with SNARE-associated domain